MTTGGRLMELGGTLETMLPRGEGIGWLGYPGLACRSSASSAAWFPGTSERPAERQRCSSRAGWMEFRRT